MSRDDVAAGHAYGMVRIGPPSTDRWCTPCNRRVPLDHDPCPTAEARKLGYCTRCMFDHPVHDWPHDGGPPSSTSATTLPEDQA